MSGDSQVWREQQAIGYMYLDGLGHHSVAPSCRQLLLGHTMTGNFRRWHLELARLSVINAEEMKSGLDGKKPRLCQTQQNVIKEDRMKVVMEAQSIHSTRQWESVSNLKREFIQ